MRSLLLSLVILFAAPAALAQDYYAQQTYQPPVYAPPPASNVYAGQPVYVPQPQPVPQSRPVPAQQHPVQPAPGEYGQSVMTDIRQMNF